MGGKELGWLLDPDLLRDRPQRGSEALDRILRFEDIEDVEAVRPFPSGMNEKPVEWKVRSRLDSRLAIRELPNDLLVPFPRQRRGLMYGKNQHRYPLAVETAEG
jgi:hypothetical protein